MDPDIIQYVTLIYALLYNIMYYSVGCLAQRSKWIAKGVGAWVYSSVCIYSSVRVTVVVAGHGTMRSNVGKSLSHQKVLRSDTFMVELQNLSFV